MTAIHKKPVAPFPDAQGTPSTSAPLTAASAIVTFIDEANPSDKNGETRADNDAAHKQEATAAATPALKTPTRGRPRMHGTGRQANRALRTPVTYAHKLAVIDYYETHERDINATVRKYYAHMTPAAVSSRKRQIYKWVKERAAIEAMCFKSSTAGHSRRRDKGTGTTLGTQGEQDLVLWIQAMQRAGPDAGVGTVSSQSVRAKAMEIAAQHGVPTGSFQATWSWQQGFVKRHQDAIQRF